MYDDRFVGANGRRVLSISRRDGNVNNKLEILSFPGFIDKLQKNWQTVYFKVHALHSERLHLNRNAGQKQNCNEKTPPM